jgi:predicted RNA-binding protein associated with RNAse of E/G family
VDDLFLDLVVSPAMEIEVKDADELLAARESGEISAAEYDLAWCTANRLIEQISNNQFGLLALSDFHRHMLLQMDPK